jgi:hypothetical protein
VYPVAGKVGGMGGCVHPVAGKVGAMGGPVDSVAEVVVDECGLFAAKLGAARNKVTKTAQVDTAV